MGYIRSAFSAFERIDQAQSEQDLRDVFAEAIAPFGFGNFLFVSSRLQPTNFSRMVILEKWPSAWRDQYQRENLFPYDPVAALARKSFDSFTWDEVVATGRNEKRVMQVSATDHDLRRGFTVPIHGTAGYQATVSIAGRDIIVAGQARMAIEMMAFYMYRKEIKLRTKCRAFLLSPREREVMSWAAAGKSAWDTGEILHISEQTVKCHISSVLAKLDVCSKAQAVAESIRRGEIDP